MIRPFKGTYPVTQEWGVNPADYVRFGLKGHNGVDYGTPTGTPIIAPHSGAVIEAAYDATGYGNYVKIENDKEGSILAHFQSFNVNAGDTVSEGQQVGLSDNTGNSTGPHLHWGYYRMPRNRGDGYSGTTNPYPFLGEPSNPPTPDTECQKQLSDLKVIETTLRDAIGHKDAQIKALYLGLPNANPAITDPNSQIQAISDSFLNLTSALNSKQQECLLLGEQLKKFQLEGSSTLEMKAKLDKLQAKYDKLKATPSKAIISILYAIAEKMGVSL